VDGGPLAVDHYKNGITQILRNRTGLSWFWSLISKALACAWWFIPPKVTLVGMGA